MECAANAAAMRSRTRRKFVVSLLQRSGQISVLRWESLRSRRLVGCRARGFARQDRIKVAARKWRPSRSGMRLWGTNSPYQDNGKCDSGRHKSLPIWIQQHCTSLWMLSGNICSPPVSNTILLTFQHVSRNPHHHISNDESRHSDEAGVITSRDIGASQIRSEGFQSVSEISSISQAKTVHRHESTRATTGATR